MTRNSPNSIDAQTFLHNAESRWSYSWTVLSDEEQSELRSNQLSLTLALLAPENLKPPLIAQGLAASPRAIGPPDWLLGEGRLAEEEYYRALAIHLGCEYYTGDPPLSRSFDAVRGLCSGVGPLELRTARPRIVVAPHPRFVPRLIEATHSGSIRSGSFALTSPQRLASLIRAYRGPDLLDVALDRLPVSLTAKGGMSGFQIAAVVIAAAVTLVLGVSDFELLQALSSAVLWLIFSASVTLRSMAAIATAPEISTSKVLDDELPNYTVVVALYREASVVEDLVKAIDALDYPKGKLDIKLVVEQRDVKTFSRLVELRLPIRYEIIVAPLGKPQTKPRALNIALSSARGDLIVVYDAEDIPDSHQLRLAASRFAADKDLDCLQARLFIRNHGESWLSQLFAIEYAILFDVINPGLCALNLPIPLGGTSNHFRVRSLVAVGAWDEWNVTEDADLGIRLSRFGYRVEALESDTSEEAPFEIGNWFRQRVRWQKGWMQTLIVHSRRPIFFWRDLGPRRAVAAMTLIVGAIFGCMLWPAFAAETIWRALTAGRVALTPWREMTDVFTYILALSGVWTVLLPALIAARFRRLEVTARTLVLLPVYYLLVSAATWGCYD